MYDIIGDIHGQADMLTNLLKRLGYISRNGVFYHPERKAVFVGDFINRGPKVRETINIVRKMTEESYAMTILGNHEINAIYHSVKEVDGSSYVKKPSILDMDSTLRDFKNNREEWESHIKWMRHLPLFLDLGAIRVVHACWRDDNIALLLNKLHGGKLKRKFLKKVGKGNSETARAFWETIKGVDFRLPKDLLVYDSSGQAHRSFRSKWWIDMKGLTFEDLSYESRFILPDYTIPQEIIKEVTPYPVGAPPVFFGHYCIRTPNIISNNLCCLDSCVSRRGRLSAYRWSGEERLLHENLII